MLVKGDVSPLSTVWTTLLLGGAITFALAPVVWYVFPHAGFMKELSASAAAYADSNKLRDLVLIPVLVAAQLILVGLLQFRGESRVKSVASESLVPTFKTWSYIGFLIATVVFVAIGALPLLATLGSGALVLLLSWRYPEYWDSALSKAALIIAGSALATHNFIGWTVADSLLLGFILSFATCLPGRAGRLLLEFGSTASAVAVAVLVAMLAPANWIPGRTLQEITALDVAVALLGLTLLALAGLKARSSLADRNKLLPAPALVLAMGIALFAVPEPVWLHLSTDDYHFGELLAAFSAVIDERTLFVDLLPAHGLVDALPGLLGWAGGDTSAGGTIWGERILAILCRCITFFLFLRFAGSAFGLVLCIVFPFSPLDVEPALILTILAAARLRQAWLSGVAATSISALAVFVSGGVGLSIAAPAYLAVAIVFLRQQTKSLIIFLAASALTGVAVAALAFDQIIGWASYLLISTQTNATIYSIASPVPPLGLTSLDQHGPSLLLAVASAMLPMAILAIVPLIAFALIRGVDQATRTKQVKVYSWLLTALPIVLFVLLQNSYAMTRIDATFPRTYIALFLSGVLLFGSLTIILQSLAPKALVALAAVCIFVGVYSVNEQYRPALLRLEPDTRLMPLSKRLTPPTPVDDLHIGTGLLPPDHVKFVRAVKSSLDLVSDPGAPFLNLTNRTALAFYIGRPASGLITSAYNSAPRSFQQATIADLERNPPKVALISAKNFEHDGYSLPLRSYELYRFVLSNYTPIRQRGVVYAVRNDSQSGLPKVWAFPELFSDVNWTNGIGIGFNQWSFFVSSDIANQINKGDVLVFANGVERTVSEKEGRNIQVDGPRLNPDDLFENNFTVLGIELTADPAPIWQDVYALPDYGRLPSAWGRSIGALEKELANTAAPVSISALNDATKVASTEDSYTTTGPDPFWSLKPESSINPRSFGLVEIEHECSHSMPVPVQIFWRTADAQFTEANSLKFTASHTTNLVPLDAMPAWLLSDPIVELRLDMGQGDQSCRTLKLKKVALRQRAMSETIQ